MTDGALPKGMEKGSSSSAPKKRGADKMGISVAIGITAVALIIGIGFTGVIPMGDEISFMEPAPSAPIVQEKPTTPVIQQAPSATYSPMKSSSYAPSDRNLIDQFDWTISTGNVMNMYLDEDSSSLIIHTDTTDDG